MRDRKVILELIFRLIGLLWHVSVGAETNPGRKSKQRHLLIGINQIVPVGISNRCRVDYCRAQHGVERKIPHQQSVLCEVALAEVITLTGLIVKT